MAFNWPTPELTVSDRVGIGTDTPSQALDIIGNISASNLTLNQNLSVSGNFQLGTLSVNEFSSDGNLADNSNLAVPTEQAVKTYVDNNLDTKAALNGSADEDFAANNLSVNDSLTVGNAIATNQLSVADKVVGSLTIENDLIVNGAISTNQLSVTDRVKGSLSIDNNLTVADQVGIGTTSPREKLEISGRVRISEGSQSTFGGHIYLSKQDGRPGHGQWHINIAPNNALNFVESGIADYRLVIQHGGNVGIGTNSPSQKLEVNGIAKTQKLRLADKWLLSGVGDAHGNDGWLRLFDRNGSDYYGGLAAGRLWASTGTLEGSDLRLKKDIANLEQSLEKLTKLRGVHYRWKDSHRDQSLQIGLIAQEVETVFPELVEVGPDGMKSLNYRGLIPPLIEAIKKQQVQIAQLGNELQSLKILSKV